MRVCSRWPLVLLVALALGGCYGAGGSSAQGAIFISWTLGGEPPSETSCAGIERLDLTVQNQYGETTTVDPIPCTLDRFRFERIPLGNAVLRLRAFTATRCQIGEGLARLYVNTEAPAQPSPIVRISPTGNCQ